ncbi:T9SS type A sorting domain-containing protein [Hymenobacter artigasi]|uniref:Plastocyanin n=1 Tax=Hymenobacter artigasi TaxID=2719616 RepID=A0ABX1HFT9_9BACT|nr:T9SS type A sorting domain-containing protein [Hymenobacter artigasi]NKI87653.1 plastocyanin [Hymenobacter artigasi]
MKLFTRLAVPMIALLLSVASAFAATITVQVGDNFYRGPDGSTTIRMAPTDVLVFQNIGSNTHPTAAAQWTTFTINPTTPTKTFPAATFTAGTYPFFCTVHSGMVGTLIVSTVTATADANLAAALSVYPNPSRGQVTVQLSQKAGQSYQLRLSNIIGQEVRTVALKPELTASGMALDLSELRTGVYFYSLLVDGKVASTKRLVLQN